MFSSFKIIPDIAYSVYMQIAAGSCIHRLLSETDDRSADHLPLCSKSTEDLPTWWGNQWTTHRLHCAEFYSLRHIRFGLLLFDGTFSTNRLYHAI